MGKIQVDAGTRVYIDKNLVDCPIPTVGRNDTGKNRTVAAGTKLPVHECDILRAALYKQNDNEQFIDFSCGFLDENYQLVGQVSWNNLKETVGGKQIAYHSGDTMACSGKGCAEVIDIDLKTAKELFPKAKYVAYSAVMWDSNPLSSCNKLFMTLSPTQEMGKDKGLPLNTTHRGYGYTKNSTEKEVFNPANVQFKVDITGDGYMSIPMLYDIENHKAVVVNIDTKTKDFRTIATNPRHFDLPIGCECLENYSTDLSIKCFAYERLDVPTIYDLATIFAEYKGSQIVATPEEADIIFSTDRIEIEDKRDREMNEELAPQIFITPFDKDIITAELIPDPKSISVSPLREKDREIIRNEQEQDFGVIER